MKQIMVVTWRDKRGKEYSKKFVKSTKLEEYLKRISPKAIELKIEYPGGLVCT